MHGGRIVLQRASKEEAEKPFWISFADLMTALMVLFLLVMSVALLAVTKTVTEAEQRKVERDREIEELLGQLVRAADGFPGITVDMARGIIDFKERARFNTASSRLTAEQARSLRAFVPEVLAIARGPLGKKWLKRIVIEGFADQRGTYLFNLNLSMQRSQRVLCVLLANPLPGERTMSHGELEQIRELFLVGGYSYNSAKKSFDESRRIELRLEFWGLEVRPPPEYIARSDFGSCALEP